MNWLWLQRRKYVQCEYDYGPFGEVIRQTGDMAKLNPFRFSTKYTDEETELVYYGYRYYSPTLGRWLNRDLIGEWGGINLYGFSGNNPMSYYDAYGLAIGDEWDPRTQWCRLRGFGKGVAGQVSGLWKVATSPIETTSGVIESVTHYDETWEAIKSAVRKALEEYLQSKSGCIDPCIALEMEGEITSEVAGMFVGVGTLSKATKLARISKLSEAKVLQAVNKLPEPTCCEVKIGGNPRFTFRGDSRAPEEVFAQGFQAKGSSTDVLSHALNSSSPPSAFIPTSKSAAVAEEFNSNVYVISRNDVVEKEPPIRN